MEVIERPTLAQVFRRFYPRYRQSSDVTPEQRRAAWCIQACRTPALGEDQWECDRCGKVHTVYHSCGNRHCPICQGARSYEWLERQQERLLPVPYFHVVFTIASELHVVFLYNRKLLYQELFAQSSSTLLDFARNPEYLGAQLGFLGVLHTWGQTMFFHPHVHYIVPQGGIDAQGRWVRPKLTDQARFLFPIKAVSEVFINRFLQHVVPKGFRRIRYYGFLANATGREALRNIQAAWLASMKAGLAVLTQYAQALEQAESEGRELDDWTPTCPDCGGPLRYRPRRFEIVRADDTS